MKTEGEAVTIKVTIRELRQVRDEEWINAFLKMNAKDRAPLIRPAVADLEAKHAATERRRSELDRDPDRLVSEFVLASYRKDFPGDHLSSCPSVIVEHPEYETSMYGCDTGCERTELRALVTCEHGNRRRFGYGTFGGLSEIIDELFDIERLGR